MTKLVTNPLFVMIVGAILIGIGIDIGGKASVIAPGIAFAFCGFFVGCVWLAKDRN